MSAERNAFGSTERAQEIIGHPFGIEALHRLGNDPMVGIWNPNDEKRRRRAKNAGGLGHFEPVQDCIRNVHECPRKIRWAVTADDREPILGSRRQPVGKQGPNRSRYCSNCLIFTMSASFSGASAANPWTFALSDRSSQMRSSLR
jgi:hypothetical protein